MGYICWKWRGFGSVYDYWIQNREARGREGDGKGTWKKRWKVTLLTLGSVDGGTREGQQNKSASTVRGRKLIPPRCCASVGRGARLPHWRSGHPTPPHFSVWSPEKRLPEWWGAGGLQVAAENTWDKTCTHTHAHTLTGTMDAKPKILMPTVVAHWKPREGCAAVCVWGVLTDYPHTPAASQEGGCQRISDPRLSSFSPRCHPRCYYVCILVIHTGSLTLLAQVNTYTHADTQAQAHTPFCHTSGAWMPGREREREMYSFTFYCARIEC